MWPESEGIAVQSMRASFYRLADVLAMGQGAQPRPVEVTQHSPRSDGSVSFPAPSGRGDYVLELGGTWLTSCIELGTYAVVSVEVR